MIRSFIALTACFLLGSSAHAQVGFDRRGGDYTNFTVRGGDPAVCALRCEREGALPRLELQLSDRRSCGGLLAQEPGAGTGSR